MEYGDRFRRSLFGGFRRQDVLRCFEELSETKEEELAALTEQIKELKRQAEEREAELSAVKNTCNELSAAKCEAEKRLSLAEHAFRHQKERAEGASSDKERAESESRAARQLMKERDVKIAVLEDKIKELSFALEESEQKSRRYNELSLEIGEVMIEAKRSAETIVSQAKKRSEKAAAETGQTALALSESLSRFLEQLSQIKLSMHGLTSGVDSKLQDLEASINDAKENISSLFGKEGQAVLKENSAEKAVRPEKVSRNEPEKPEEPAEKVSFGKKLNRLIELIGKE